MDIYSKREDARKIKTLREENQTQRALLQKAVNAMNEMLEAFEKSGYMLEETDYCNSCNCDKESCPYRDSDGNSCYNGYGRETQVSELIREIIDEVL